MRVVLHRVRERDERLCDEGLAQLRELVEHDAKRPHVSLRRIRLAAHGLGRQVIRRAHNRLRQLGAVLELLCDAKVAERELAVSHDEDVLRLEVAVDDRAAVDAVEGTGELRSVLKDLVVGEALVRLDPRGDPLGKVAARAVRHDHAEVHAAVLLEGIVDGDDGRVVAQLTQNVHLALRRVGHLGRREALHHEERVRLDVAHEKHV